MPEIEMNPSVLRTAIEEVGTPLMKKAVSEVPALKKVADLSDGIGAHLNRGDVLMRGKSGEFNRDLFTAMNRRADYHESLINKQNQQLGVSLPEGRTRSMAFKRARKEIALANDAHIVSGIKWAAQEHGAEHATHLANWWQVALQDREYFPPEFKTGPEGTVTSKPGTKSTAQLRENIMKARMVKDKVAKQQMLDIGRAMGPPPKVPEEAYMASKTFKVSRAILSPFAAAKHLEQFATLGSNQPSFSTTFNTYRTLFGSGRKAMQDLMLLNDAGGGMLSDIAAEVHRYQNGYLRNIKWLPPEVGQWISKNAAMPLMGALRQRLVPAAAAKGYFISIHEIESLMKDPKLEGSRSNLAYMGFPRSMQDDLIDRYKANGNKLTPEDARTAMNTAIEQYAFTNNPLWRSKFALHPVGRFFTTYHWAAQGTKGMVQRDIMRAMRSRNPVQMASTLAAYAGRMGVIYSVAKVMDMLRGTQEPSPDSDSPEDNAKRHFRRMNMLADMIGWGSEWQIVNGAAHNHLGDEMYGAQIANLIRGTEDFTKGATMSMEGRKHAMYPFMRDLFEELPWFMGDRLAHSMYPTTAEKAADRPITPAVLRGRKSARKRMLKGED
jgi:hypothetical protein